MSAGHRQKEREIKIKKIKIKNLGKSQSKNYLEEWRELTEGGKDEKKEGWEIHDRLKVQSILDENVLSPGTMYKWKLQNVLKAKHIVSINL